MAIGITLLERTQGDPRNSLILFDRFGRRRLTYAKVHTCDFEEERFLTPGSDFPSPSWTRRSARSRSAR